LSAFEAYGKDDVDFSALLTKVKASGADVLFLPDYYNKVGLIAKQAQEKGLKIQLVGPDGWDSPDLMKIAGSAIEGGYFSNHYSPDDLRPEVVAWVKKYREKHGQVPDALGTLAYDARICSSRRSGRRGATTRGRSGMPSPRSGISTESPGNPRSTGTATASRARRS